MVPALRRTHHAEHHPIPMQSAAPACLFPSKSVEYPLSRSRAGHGEPDRWPRGRSEDSGQYHRAKAGSASPPAAEKGAGNQGEGRGEGQTPAAEAGRGSTHPAAASRSPRSPGAGRASLRRGPCAPLRALRRSLRTPPARPAAPRTLPAAPPAEGGVFSSPPPLPILPSPPDPS